MRRVARRLPKRTVLPPFASLIAFVSVLVTLTGVASGAHDSTGPDLASPVQAASGATGPSGPEAPSGPSGGISDSYMSVPNSTDFDYSSSFSFEIWVNPGANPFVTYRAIACNTLYPSTGWLLATDRNGGLIFQTGNGDPPQR